MKQADHPEFDLQNIIDVICALKSELDIHSVKIVDKEIFMILCSGNLRCFGGLLITSLILISTLVATVAVANSGSNDSACIDVDGDGWGWDGQGSCLVESDNSQSFNGAGECLDSDGDGWGWDGRVTCVVESDTSHNSDSSSGNSSSGDCRDSDGDGWGWDGVKSCRMEDSVQSSDNSDNLMRSSGSRVSENCQKLDSGNYHITELVTDVFLTAGQSNAAGNLTRYEPETFYQDKTSDRLIVWTENNRWEAANPKSQVWHDRFPGGRNTYFNHPAFQIGRAIVNSHDCRVVAFVATAAPGKAIDYWRHNEDRHYSSIGTKVNSALNALPGISTVDMIWWMQGEADNDQVVDRYSAKLTDLINRFRSESWFDWDSYFLANETGWSHYANSAIKRLRTDHDPFTDYSRGQDLSQDPFPYVTTGGPNRTHFNAVALRKIGDIVARKYLREYLPARGN